MQNFTLLEEVGRCRMPVLLKRGMSATLAEYLQAAEYVLAAATTQVILCERGIRTFETVHAQHARPERRADAEAPHAPAGARRSRATAPGRPGWCRRWRARRSRQAPTACSIEVHGHPGARAERRRAVADARGVRRRDDPAGWRRGGGRRTEPSAVKSFLARRGRRRPGARGRAARTRGRQSPFESAAAPDVEEPDRRDRLRRGSRRWASSRPRLCSDAVFVRRVVPRRDRHAADRRRGARVPGRPRRRTSGARSSTALLEREEFADYWAMKWSDVLRVKSEFPINLWPNAVQAYHRWIRDQPPRQRALRPVRARAAHRERQQLPRRRR